MSPVHLVVGGLCLAITGGLIAAVAFYETPEAQHVVVKNEFEDAKCNLAFYNGSHGSFTVAKGGEYETRFNSPKDGFVVMSCKTASQDIAGPAGLYFVKGGLTTLTLNAEGKFDLTFTHDTEKCRQCVYGVDPKQQDRLN